MLTVIICYLHRIRYINLLLNGCCFHRYIISSKVGFFLLMVSSKAYGVTIPLPDNFMFKFKSKNNKVDHNKFEVMKNNAHNARNINNSIKQTESTSHHTWESIMLCLIADGEYHFAGYASAFFQSSDSLDDRKIEMMDGINSFLNKMVSRGMYVLDLYKVRKQNCREFLYLIMLS